MNDLIKNYLEQLNKNNFKYPYVEIRALLNKSSISKKEIILSNFDKKQINLSVFKKAFKLIDLYSQ